MAHIYSLITWSWQWWWHRFNMFLWWQDCEKYKLGDAKTFHYLNQSGCYDLNNVSNSREYAKTRRAMDVVGINSDDQVPLICCFFFRHFWIFIWLLRCTVLAFWCELIVLDAVPCGGQIIGFAFGLICQQQLPAHYSIRTLSFNCSCLLPISLKSAWFNEQIL